MQKWCKLQITKLNAHSGISAQAGGEQASLGWVLPRYEARKQLFMSLVEQNLSPSIYEARIRALCSETLQIFHGGQGVCVTVGGIEATAWAFIWHMAYI